MGRVCRRPVVLVTGAGRSARIRETAEPGRLALPDLRSTCTFVAHLPPVLRAVQFRRQLVPCPYVSGNEAAGGSGARLRLRLRL